MIPSPSIVERAYHLAATGNYTTMREIRRRLADEGYEHVETEIRGKQLLQSLREKINLALQSNLLRRPAIED